MSAPDHILDCNCESVTWLCFSPGADWLAVAASVPYIRLWSLSDRRLTRAMPAPRVGRTDALHLWYDWVSFTRDGTCVLSLDCDGRLCLCDTQSDTCESLAEFSKCISVAALAPDSCTLAWGTDEGVVVWDLRLRKTERALDFGVAAPGLVSCVGFSPSGDTVAAALDSDTAVTVFGLGDASPLLRLVGHDDLVLALDYSQDGRLLATASRDNSVRVWRLDGGQEIARFQGDGNLVRSVAFSPNGYSGI